MSLMEMGKFATINDERAAMARTIDELIKLGDIYKVHFVPYRPAILDFLLDVIPNRETGEKFTQKTFAAACTETAARMGVMARGDKPLEITQRTVSNYCDASKKGTKPNADVLEVMSEVLGVYLVPGLDRSVDTEKILANIKKHFS